MFLPSTYRTTMKPRTRCLALFLLKMLNLSPKEDEDPQTINHINVSPLYPSDTDSTYGWNDAVNTLQHNYKGPLQSAKSFSGIFGNHTSFAITSFAITSDHQNIKFAVDSRIYNYSCVSDALWAKLD